MRAAYSNLSSFPETDSLNLKFVELASLLRTAHQLPLGLTRWKRWPILRDQCHSASSDGHFGAAPGGDTAGLLARIGVLSEAGN